MMYGVPNMKTDKMDVVQRRWGAELGEGRFLGFVISTGSWEALTLRFRVRCEHHEAGRYHLHHGCSWPCCGELPGGWNRATYP